MREFVPESARLLPQKAKKVFSGEIFEVYQWPQELYDGSMATFEMLKRPDTVRVITVLSREEQEKLAGAVKFTTLSETALILTKQEQPHKGIFYGFPGGRVDETDENELAGAKREMKEETGLEFKNWRLIGVKQPFNKIDWLVYTFLATGLLRTGKQSLDPGEKIEVMGMDFDEVKELAKQRNADYLAMDYSNIEELRRAESLHQY